MWLKPIFYLCLALSSSAVFASSPVELDSKETKKLNTFFSNFSESGVTTYDEDSVSDKQLLAFALSHLYKNNFKSLAKAKDGLNVIASQEQVDRVTLKYFNKKIQKPVSRSYSIPLADGEATVFSQVKKVVKEGANLQVEGVVYMTGSGGTPDPHGSPASWKAAGEEVEPKATFNAIISNKEGRYILHKYTETIK